MEWKIEENLKYPLAFFLGCFTPETRICILDENEVLLDENTVGEITQGIMNQRVVLKAYLKRDKLVVITVYGKGYLKL